MAKAKAASAKTDDDLEFGLAVPNPQDVQAAEDQTVEAPAVEVTASAAVETPAETAEPVQAPVPPEPPKIQTLRIPFPIIAADAPVTGYVATSLNMQLSPQDVGLWKRFVLALREGHAMYAAPGNVVRHVDSASDAIRWLLQQARMELEDTDDGPAIPE